MQHSSKLTRAAAGAAILACTLATGCVSSRLNWGMIQSHAPSGAAVAVGVNPEGVTWFFECDAQTLMSGLRIRTLQAPDGQEKTLSIKFDAEPAEQSVWRIEKSTYVMRGEPATLLARRAALAYNALLNVDGAPIKFALTGSHSAMIDLTRNCPFLDVK